MPVSTMTNVGIVVTALAWIPMLTSVMAITNNIAIVEKLAPLLNWPSVQVAEMQSGEPCFSINSDEVREEVVFILGEIQR